MTYCLQNIDIPPTLDENQNETSDPDQHGSNPDHTQDQGHSNQGQGQSCEGQGQVDFSLGGDESGESDSDSNTDSEIDIPATCDRKPDSQRKRMNSAKSTDSEETEFRSAKSDNQFLHRNLSFSEERWLKYDRQEDELAFDIRNKQLHKRVDEIQQLCDILEDLNSGQLVHNVLGLQFDLLQFKVCYKFSLSSFGGIKKKLKKKNKGPKTINLIKSIKC